MQSRRPAARIVSLNPNTYRAAPGATRDPVPPRGARARSSGAGEPGRGRPAGRGSPRRRGCAARSHARRCCPAGSRRRDPGGRPTPQCVPSPRGSPGPRPGSVSGRRGCVACRPGSGSRRHAAPHGPQCLANDRVWVAPERCVQFRADEGRHGADGGAAVRDRGCGTGTTVREPLGDQHPAEQFGGGEQVKNDDAAPGRGSGARKHLVPQPAIRLHAPRAQSSRGPLLVEPVEGVRRRRDRLAAVGAAARLARLHPLEVGEGEPPLLPRGAARQHRMGDGGGVRGPERGAFDLPAPISRRQAVRKCLIAA